jgi:YfiH family protein
MFDFPQLALSALRRDEREKAIPEGSMIVHSAGNLTIYFGDKQDDIHPAFYLNLDTTDSEILHDQRFSHVRNALNLDRLLFLHQVHGTDGLIIFDSNQVKPYKTDGDYLITRLLRTGIGIMTADCLPIVFYDPIKNVIAVAHAGWRGSVQEIGVVTLREMHKNFGTQLKDVQVFFGPSAKPCCYAVDDLFGNNLASHEYGVKTLQKREQKLYFDLPLFNKLQLEKGGVLPENFNLDYNLCTLCDDRFFSYRKLGAQAGRQMTVACLI